MIDSRTPRLATVSGRHRWRPYVVFACLLICLSAVSVRADDAITRLCPTDEIAPRSPEFPGTGIILTQFDNASLWVYEVGRDRRYPLPDTNVCLNHCRLSPDRRWITYFNDMTNAFNRMTLLGTQRSLIAEYASDVEWWSEDTLLIWTPARSAYLRPADDVGGEREVLTAPGVTAVQPGGRYALLIEQDGDSFTRALINLAAPAERRLLGEDRTYFNAHQWSPDGRWLAFVEPVPVDERIGSELFGIKPGDETPVRWTRLNAAYGAARINGVAVGDLAWSPDGERIAFWVTPITGDDPLTDTGDAMLHIFDVTSRALTAYCGYSTTRHTPNPPHLVWSPDGRYVAFGGAVEGNDQAYVLLALDTETGIYTDLSEGISPALGAPDVVAWGLPPA
jgi:Tol biopolymer transport system component